jgi:hypothetical protein
MAMSETAFLRMSEAAIRQMSSGAPYQIAEAASSRPIVFLEQPHPSCRPFIGGAKTAARATASTAG